MSITITIEGNSAAQIRECLIGLAGMTLAPASPSAIVAVANAEAAATPTKTKVKKEADKPAPTPVVEEPVQTEEDTAEDIDDITLRAAASAKATTKELKVAVKALLDTYGVKNVTGLPQDKRAAFLADLEAL